MNDDWRRHLAAMRKGPLDERVPRHAPFKRTITLPGDWTGATLAGQLRLYPDAAASLVSFTVAGPTVGGGSSVFVISLTEAQLENTAIVPAAAEAGGDTTLVYDLLLTPSGGTKELLWGGNFTVVGGATNV